MNDNNVPSLNPVPVSAPQIPVPATNVAVPLAVPPAKKGFPKIIIAALGTVILIVLILLAVKLIAGSKKTSLSQITWWGLWEDPATVQPLIAT